MRSRSPCALRSTTISEAVCTRRKLDSSCARQRHLVSVQEDDAEGIRGLWI